MRPRDEVRVFLCREPVDMRRSIDGLSIEVERELGLDPFAPQLVAFCNRRRDKVKILYWDKSGFALWYKRLERDRFAWPRDMASAKVLSLTGRELNWLLDGIDIFSLRPHAERRYATVL